METWHIVILLTLSILTQSQTLAANERVIDADTIEISGQKIRLSGIDAPELKQTCKDATDQIYNCGKEATEKLLKLLKSMPEYPIQCEFTGKDVYGRLIGDCRIKNININSWIVRNGWAIAYRKYSMKYVDEESFAKANTLGIWQGSFVKPWRWRKGRRLELKEESKKSGCSIKGNISSGGEKIFHTEAGKHYKRTKIAVNRGEKWFCSEEEAIKNGWRKSKQ